MQSVSTEIAYSYKMLANVDENKTKQAVDTSKCADKVQPLTFPGVCTFQWIVVVWSNSFTWDVIFVFISNENEFDHNCFNL